LDALHQCHDLLAKYGGHSASAGVSLKAENLQAFRDAIDEAAKGLISDEPIMPVLEVDACLENGSQLTYRLLDDMGRLAPFGRENPMPVFMTEGALVLRAERKGKDANTCILQLRLPGAHAPFKAVRFKGGDWADKIQMGDNIDIVYSPKYNEWQGSVNIELMLHDFRPSA
jgi:single-stranded-DNA-specific exonuclease